MSRIARTVREQALIAQLKQARRRWWIESGTFGIARYLMTPFWVARVSDTAWPALLSEAGLAPQEGLYDRGWNEEMSLYDELTSFLAVTPEQSAEVQRTPVSIAGIHYQGRVFSYDVYHATHHLCLFPTVARPLVEAWETLRILGHPVYGAFLAGLAAGRVDLAVFPVWVEGASVDEALSVVLSGLPLNVLGRTAYATSSALPVQSIHDRRVWEGADAWARRCRGRSPETP